MISNNSLSKHYTVKENIYILGHLMETSKFRKKKTPNLARLSMYFRYAREETEEGHTWTK